MTTQSTVQTNGSPCKQANKKKETF